MRKPQPIFYQQMALTDLILAIVMLTGIIHLPSLLGHVLFWMAIAGRWIGFIVVEFRGKR